MIFDSNTLWRIIFKQSNACCHLPSFSSMLIRLPYVTTVASRPLQLAPFKT